MVRRIDVKTLLSIYFHSEMTDGDMESLMKHIDYRMCLDNVLIVFMGRLEDYLVDNIFRLDENTLRFIKEREIRKFQKYNENSMYTIDFLMDFNNCEGNANVRKQLL